jgi:hypothetical protein
MRGATVAPRRKHEPVAIRAATVRGVSAGEAEHRGTRRCGEKRMTGDQGDGARDQAELEAMRARQLAHLRQSSHEMASALAERLEPGNPPIVGMSGTRYWSVRGRSVPAGEASDRDLHLLVAQRGHLLVLLNGPADRSLIDATLATITTTSADIFLSAARSFLEDADDLLASALRQSAGADLRGRPREQQRLHGDDELT